MSDDQQGWAGQVNDRLEHNAGFGVDDFYAMNQRSQSLRKQQEILEQQKKIAKALDAQQREQKRIESLPKCPRCVSPVETTASVCRQCNTNVVIIGPLSRDYIELRKSGSGHLIFEQMETATRFEELKRKFNLLRNELQTTLDAAMTRLAKAAVHLSLLHRADAEALRTLNSSKQPEDASKKQYTGHIVFDLSIISFCFLCLEAGVVKVAGVQVPENFAENYLLLIWLLFTAVMLIVINYLYRIKRTRARSKYLEEKSEFDKSSRKATEYLARYGLAPLDQLKSVFSIAKNTYSEIAGGIATFYSDWERVHESAQALGVAFPSALSSPITAAFIRGGRYCKPAKGLSKAAIDELIRECGKYVTVPPLPLEQQQSATENDSSYAVKTNKVTDDDFANFPGIALDDVEVELEPISEFWVRRGKAMRGPVSREVVQDALMQGQLDATDLIASHENGPWIPLSEGVNQYGFN